MSRTDNSPSATVRGPNGTSLLPDVNCWSCSACVGQTEIDAPRLRTTTCDGTHTYTYDANGNMLTKNLSGSPVATYTYDTQNRLTQVGMGANTTNFVYDDTRQRISKTDITASTNKTTIYWFDDFEQTFDNNASGALIETTKSYSANGKKIAQRTSSDSALLYLYQDHLSSTSVVTDNLGTVVSRMQYEPYGKLASANNDKVKELFTGQDWDASIDLYYYNARYYNPNIGRFTQGDPAIVDMQFDVTLSVNEQLNPFMYCNNNPVVYVDPTGLYDSSDLDIGFYSYYETYVAPTTTWGSSSGSSGYSGWNSSYSGNSSWSTPSSTQTVEAKVVANPDAGSRWPSWAQTADVAVSRFVGQNIFGMGPEQWVKTMEGYQVPISDTGYTSYSDKLKNAAFFIATSALGLTKGLYSAAGTEAKGGVYVLRDAESTVVRSGRTKDLAMREAQHARNPEFKDLTFETVYRTDTKSAIRGLEKMVHDLYKPVLDKIRPISPTNPRLNTYMEAARKFLERLK